MKTTNSWKYQTQIPLKKETEHILWCEYGRQYKKNIYKKGNKPILTFPTYMDDNYIDQIPVILKKIKELNIRIINYYRVTNDLFSITFFNEEDAVTIKMLLL